MNDAETTDTAAGRDPGERVFRQGRTPGPPERPVPVRVGAEIQNVLPAGAMTDEDAFLAAVRAAPDDRTARLVYADWLDDHDRPADAWRQRACAEPDVIAYRVMFAAAVEPEDRKWAEFVRLSVQLADIPDRLPDPTTGHPGVIPNPLWEITTHRVAVLVAKHGWAWLPDLPGLKKGYCGRTDGDGVSRSVPCYHMDVGGYVVPDFVGGFVERVTCPWAAWRAHHADLRLYNPVRHVTLTDRSRAVYDQSAASFELDFDTPPPARFRFAVPDEIAHGYFNAEIERAVLGFGPTDDRLLVCLLERTYPGVTFAVPPARVRHRINAGDVVTTDHFGRVAPRTRVDQEPVGVALSGAPPGGVVAVRLSEAARGGRALDHVVEIGFVGDDADPDDDTPEGDE